MKKTITLILTIILIAMTFCACDNNKGAEKSKDGLLTWYFGGKNGLTQVDPTELFKDVKDTVDTDKIYSSTKYNEKMLYGSYTLYDSEKDLKKLREKVSYKKYEFDNGTYEMLTVPVAVHFGKDYISSAVAGYEYADFEKCTDIEVAVMVMATKEEKGTLICKYTVEDNKIKFTELNKLSKSGEELKYEIGKNEFEYEFSIKGPYLTLINGNDSVELTSYCFTNNGKDDFEISGYSLPDSPIIDELDYFHASSDVINYASKRNGEYYKLSAFKMSDDGRLSVYLVAKDKNGEEVKFIKQYAYIAQSTGSFLNWVSLVLLDGEKEYYYTDDISMREARQLADEGFNTAEISEEKIKEIAEKKSDLFDDLYSEFQSNGINVTINRATGEMAMDATVLFGGDSAVITQDGKNLLNKFLAAYTSIIYNQKYDGFISKTLIEGHTAPVAGSTYESGLPLSEERANNVKDYCISSDTGVDTSKLSTSLEAVGCSNSKPIYNNIGEVDMAACRRVSFKFIINVE